MTAEATFKEAVAEHDSGNLSQAKSLYLSCLSEKPEHAESHFNLGTLYMQEEAWQSAVIHFQQANTNQPNTPSILYNLAVAHLHTEHVGAALATVEQAVQFDPKHFQARHLHACLLYKTGHPDRAEQAFIEALKLKQDDAEAWFNFAVFCLEFNDLEQAEKYFHRALACQPDHQDALANLIVLNDYQNDPQTAVYYLKEMVKQHPDDKNAWLQCITRLQADKRLKEAAEYCQKAQARYPDEQSFQFLADVVLGSEASAEMPGTYIEALFSSYAKHYDRHMQKFLDYQLPQQIAAGLQAHLPIDDKTQWTILDLGCGTGLSGEVLQQYASRLVGVDISAEMLAKAQQKNIYDETVCCDIQSFFSNNDAHFELIVAADLFGYLPDLSALFQAITPSLQENAYFVFSVEQTDATERATLSTNMRYQHNPNYIDKLLKQYQFNTLAVEKDICIRKNDGQPVLASLFFTQRL